MVKTYECANYVKNGRKNYETLCEELWKQYFQKPKGDAKKINYSCILFCVMF